MLLTVAGAMVPAMIIAISSGASISIAVSGRVRSASLFTAGCCSGGALDGVVGVGEGLLGRVEHGLHLVQLLTDTPQRPALAVHGPAGDQPLGDGAEPEQPVELFG